MYTIKRWFRRLFKKKINKKLSPYVYPGLPK